MKDLTETFKKIISSNVYWTPSIFYDALEILKNNNIEFSFWEEEESWVTILNADRIIGYMWKKYPLITIEKENAFQIKELLKNIEGICYIEVKSLNEDLFSIDDASLRNYLEDFQNYNSFTIEDLWFQTNSR